MATHHGRPGGRLVEVLAAFALIGVSVAVLVGPLGVILFGWIWLVANVPQWLLIFMIATNSLALPYVIKPILGQAWRLLKAVWGPFLKYYKYQAHTLRPLDDEGADT